MALAREDVAEFSNAGKGGLALGEKEAPVTFRIEYLPRKFVGNERRAGERQGAGPHLFAVSQGGPIAANEPCECEVAFEEITERILYWGEMTIAPFTYTPLAVEIVAEPEPTRPLLSWIWGLPMLGLPDLIRQYRGIAAETEEFGRRSRARDTAGALADIMTSAANPEPPNPAIAALRDYRCSHLMISSASNAAARSAAYPRSYYV